jgi:hypothetical protein
MLACGAGLRSTCSRALSKPPWPTLTKSLEVVEGLEAEAACAWLSVELVGV